MPQSTHIRIEKSLQHLLKIQAAIEGKSIQSVASRLIRSYLSRIEKLKVDGIIRDARQIE